MKTKTCTKCKQEFPATNEYFHKRAPSSDGLNIYCKPCACANAKRHNQNPEYRARQRKNHLEWEHRNMEKTRERKRILTQKRYWEIKGDPERYAQLLEKSRIYHRNRYAQDKEYRRKAFERSTRYQKTDKGRETSRLWVKANSIKVRAYCHARRFRLAQSAQNWTKADIELQLESQQSRCWFCQKDISKRYEIDHFIPLTRGGSNAPNNIVLSCRKCNRSRNNKLPHEWNGKLI